MMRSGRIFAAVLSVLCVLVPLAHAGDAIALKYRAFTPEATADAAVALRSHAGQRVVVQLTNTPNAGAREAMAKRGVHLLTPLSGTAWLARVENRAFDEKAPWGVRWVGRLATADKLHREVAEGRFAPWTAATGGARVLSVHLFPDVADTEAAALLGEFGRVVEHTDATNSYYVAMDAARVVELAERDEVVWIEPPLPALAPNLDVAKPAVGGDTANEDYGVSGEGIKVLILDGGVVIPNSHDDLAGRVTVVGLPVPDIIVGHATNVMGIVGGDGTVSGGQYVGIAPKVTFVSATALPFSIPPLYNSPASIEGQYKQSIQNHAVDVSNNSIGANLAEFGTIWCDREGDYEGTAQLIDALVGGKYGPITIVWANGNERGYTACGNSYGTTPPPAGAKNSIAVGAVNKDTLAMTFFSSYGPVDDGRLRPDLSAPGCVTDGSSFESGITATGLRNGYVSFCGTSQASPMVTGAAALVHEYWIEHMGGEHPWASTVKALLIHGALDEDEPGPNYRYGYGVLDIPASLDVIDDGFVDQTELDQGDEDVYNYSATGAVKVTLVWTDVPGPLLTAKALVNDLDLSVEVNGEIVRPYVLDPENPSASAERGENHRDTAEQVIVDAGPGDAVRVIVKGFEVPQGPQSYSLAVTGVSDEAPADDDADDDADVDADDDSGDDDAADDDDDDDDDDGCGC